MDTLAKCAVRARARADLSGPAFLALLARVEPMSNGATFLGRQGNRASPAASAACRGPTTIPGPIVKVENRAGHPDLRIAERSWWPLVERGVGRRRKWGGFFDLPTVMVEDGRVFFVLPAPKIEDGGFFVLRTPKIEEPPHLRRTPRYLRRCPTPPSPSFVRSSTHSSGPKIEDE